METSHNQRESASHKKQIRDSEIDIIAGASQEDQLEALKANARNSSEKESEKEKTLSVNNGLNSPENDDKKDLDNPATRGI